MRKIQIVSLILIGLLFILTSMTFAGKQEFGYNEIPKLDNKITIDGVIEEEEWLGSEKIYSYNVTKGETDVIMKTNIFWTEEYLYFASFSNDSKVWGTYSGANSPVWKNDSIELFIDVKNSDVSGRSTGSYQLCFGPGDAYYDFEGTEENDKPADWNSNMEFKTKVLGTKNEFSDEDEGWVVEGRVPWESMNWDPEAGQIMGFNAHNKIQQPNGPNAQVDSSSGLDWVHDVSTWHIVKLVE